MNKSNSLKLLFDGDMIVYQACASAETEVNWGEGLHTLHSQEGESKALVDDKIITLANKVLGKLKYEGEYEYVLCFSDDVNFRKKLYPLYKANRKDKRKPVCYRDVVAWAKEAYSCYQRPTLEADDCLGILATAPSANTVIISGDKDFKTIPGVFFDYGHNELYNISPEEAFKWHMYQTLIGDTADNYPGCPGVGAVGAKKILEGTDGTLWERVVNQFKKKGLTEADAILMARVAKILQWNDFDMKNREVRLWEPPSMNV